MWVQSLGQEDPLEEGMATHSSILAREYHGQKRLVGFSEVQSTVISPTLFIHSSLTARWTCHASALKLLQPRQSLSSELLYFNKCVS